MQKPIPSTLRRCGCKENKDEGRSSLLSAEMCKTSENVGKSFELLCKMFAAVARRTKDD